MNNAALPRKKYSGSVLLWNAKMALPVLLPHPAIAA
jgi:hypothetical protein